MPDTPEARRPETILAFDFGLRRIGVAVGQQVTQSASALATVSNGEGGADWAHISALINEWQPARLIVGMPETADGSPPALFDAITAFCSELEQYGRPVATIDERYSSQAANQQLIAARRDGRRGRISKGDLDAAAAACIAERWLQRNDA
ncbi:MAG: Holliday junction resolvase RuvX [Woeseia sp.]